MKMQNCNGRASFNMSYDHTELRKPSVMMEPNNRGGGGKRIFFITFFAIVMFITDTISSTLAFSLWEKINLKKLELNEIRKILGKDCFSIHSSIVFHLESHIFIYDVEERKGGCVSLKCNNYSSVV